MRQGQLRILGALVLTIMGSSIGAGHAVAQSKFVSGNGKLAGVVRDTSGTPQMGASVEIIPEVVSSSSAITFLTNTQGIFRGDRLPPGLYSVRVTLAGFLPTLQQHVRITANLTTMLRVQMQSLFASLDQLRRQPSSASVDPDDWKWVLRSAPSMRPVLEWVQGGGVVSASASSTEIIGVRNRPRAQVEFTDGARRPGSVSNLAASPSTAFAYDQKLGAAGQLLFAGQVSYAGDAPAGGIAAVWMPGGSLGAGPHTALVMREAKVGPDGPTFRGVRFEQGGAVALGSRALLQYGGEYVLVGLGSAASSLRPHLELDIRASENWQAAVVFASLPAGAASLESLDEEQNASLTAALNELDAFPALLWRNGRPVLQSGMHEEIAASKKIGSRGKLQIAAFHDDNRHIAIFGRGSNLPEADYFQDYFSNGFAYDGGSSSNWGGRLAFQEKLSNDLELTAVYAFAGALAPLDLTDGNLRDVLRTVPRHSVAVNATARIPRLHTRVTTGYKWVDGVTVSRVDAYGEALFQTDPFLHIGMRQPLPKFAPGHWEAIVDCDNLLAQGYVPMSSRDGQVFLIPAFRTFRGGLSVQF